MLYWAWKSRRGRKGGRPKIDKEVGNLIRKMSRENLTRGVPRIRAELALLGHEVTESTVRKYIDWFGKRLKDFAAKWREKAPKANECF